MGKGGVGILEDSDLLPKMSLIKEGFRSNLSILLNVQTIKMLYGHCILGTGFTIELKH